MQVEPISTDRLDLLPLRADHADEMVGVLADPALYDFTGGVPPTRRLLRARYERQVAGSGDPAERWYNWVIRLREAGRLCGTVQATVRTGVAQASVSSANDPPAGRASVRPADNRPAGRASVGSADHPPAGRASVGSADHPPAGRASVGSADYPPADQHVAEVAWVIGVPWQGQGIATEAARALIGWLAQLPALRVIAHIHPGNHASAAVASACGLAPTGQWQDGEMRWQLTLARP